MANDLVTKGSKKRPKKFVAKGLLNALLESALGRPVVFSQAKKNDTQKIPWSLPRPFLWPWMLLKKRLE